MTFWHALAERIRRGEPVPAPLAALLTIATPIQRGGMWLRLQGARERVEARVVSFGNLTAGGTGKTPAVIARARLELAAGRRVGVLTRGFGGRRSSAPLIVCGDEPWPEMLNDEARLVLRLAPGVVVAQHPDRVMAARQAIAAHNLDTLILDDGFQYVRLERDENVLVVDAANPFGNGHVVPRGILREPIAAAARATHILVTRCDRAQNVAALVEQLRIICPRAPLRLTRHAPARLWRVAGGAGGAEDSLDSLRGQRVVAVCAIARPEAFRATLEGLGAVVIEQRVFPDHAPIPPEAFSGADRVIITEKDAVRVGRAPEHVYALGIELQEME